MDQRDGARRPLREYRRGTHARSEPPAPAPGELAEDEHQALLRVAAAASGAPALEDVLELAAEEALSAVGASSLSVSRWDRARNCLRTLINVGELGPGEERFPEDERYGLDENPHLKRMFTNAQPYFNAVDDPNSDPEAVALLKELGKESDLAVPIVTEGELWGEVWAANKPGELHFRGGDVRFLEAIAGQLAVAIGRAELFTRVSRLAYEDPLTGLPNRRALEERLERAVVRAQGEDLNVAVILCDVDNLKGINDTRGHDAGDRALARVGAALVAAAADHSGTLVGRLSGDEFCVLIEGAGLDAARDVANEALEILGRDRDLALSLSCGAAVSGPRTEDPDSLLRAADAAQYAAKRRGGGQFCTAEAGFVPELPMRGRRLFRSDADERVRAAAATVADLLDGDLADRPPLDRLEAVAAALAEAVNAAAWAISFSPTGSAQIRSVATADDRDSRLAGLRVGLEQEVYRLQQYPATARVVGAGSGAFLMQRTDPAAEPAEVRLLEDAGHHAVLGAAAAGYDGTYLVELFGDDSSSALSEAEISLRLLTRAAIPPQAVADREKEQILERTRRLELTSALGARLAGATDRDAIVRATVEELGMLGYPVCVIVRVNEDELLEVVADSQASGPGRWAGWSAPVTSGLIGRALLENRTVNVRDVRGEPDYRSTAATADSLSELDVPVRVGGHQWGAVTLQDTKVSAFTDEDARLLETVADQLGSALHSVELYDQLERAYLGTAEALSEALEAKDAYTASHSESIMRRSELVGEQLGMAREELRLLRYGAAFHDIGKLAVPEAILRKPGPLTPAERQEIERHTIVGERILAPVEFLADVLPLVRHAHERWDGQGYPDGLAAGQIPLGARIIFACDAYDAMTSNRPYRKALPGEEALAELGRSAGTQFDPQVVAALLAVLGAANGARAAS